LFFLCFIKVKLSVKVKLFVPLCVCAILPAEAIPEMTYTVSGGTLNPTHSLTLALLSAKVKSKSEVIQCMLVIMLMRFTNFIVVLLHFGC